jgi:cytochrome oxidase Cu insertion factor (SCO1/SenC/PrrC family)
VNAVSLRENRAPSPGSAVWKTVLLGFPLVVATVFFFVWRAQVSYFANRPVGSYGTVPQFQLINQDNRPFGSKQLAGKIWIADFIFTTCPGPCPLISTRMRELQKPLEKTDVHLVSITVDPEKDTPKVLRNYAEQFQAEPGRWDFLTGAKSTIYNLTQKGFKLAVSDGREETGTPVHSTRMVLLDRHGEIRGYYEATEADAVTKLLADTNHLLREQPR